MGQKVNPVGLRIGVIRDWESKWYAGKDYADFLHEDLKIREYISKRLSDASVSKVEIERAANRVNITIDPNFTATFHVTSHRNTCSFDLTVSNPRSF